MTCTSQGMQYLRTPHYSTHRWSEGTTPAEGRWKMACSFLSQAGSCACTVHECQAPAVQRIGDKVHRAVLSAATSATAGVESARTTLAGDANSHETQNQPATLQPVRRTRSKALHTRCCPAAPVLRWATFQKTALCVTEPWEMGLGPRDLTSKRRGVPVRGGLPRPRECADPPPTPRARGHSSSTRSWQWARVEQRPVPALAGLTLLWPSGRRAPSSGLTL